MTEELKRAFCSRLFWISFLIMLLCFAGYSIPSWLLAGEVELEYKESALQLSIGAIFFGSIMMFMPFCAAVSHAVSQVDDIHTSTLQWQTIRSSIKKYACIKMATSSLAAACSTAGAFVMHALICNIVALPVDPGRYQGHEIGFLDTCLYAGWYKVAYGLPMYTEMAIGIAFSAAVWAVVALAVAVWVPDRLLVVSIPACFYYIWHLQLPYYLFGVNIPHPGTLYNDALTAESAMQCIVAYGVVLLVSIPIYWVGLRRRMSDA